MKRWQYEKIDLNALPRKTTDLDRLNEVGDEGWELVAITANNFAIFKRPAAASRKTQDGHHPQTTAK